MNPSERKKKKLFIRGAYLVSLEKELTEKEFIEKAGGLQKLLRFRSFPLVTLVLDNPKKPLLIGHNSGRTIQLVLESHGHGDWQTMEWKE